VQESRRGFVKKTAIVTAGAVTIGATVLAAGGTKAVEAGSNGVVVGSSNKTEINYKKTQAWEDYYKQAK